KSSRASKRAPGFCSEQLLEMLGVVERPDQRESELLVLDQLLRDALHVLARHGVQPLEHLVEVRRALLEHLAPQAEQDQPLRALELEDEAPLREVASLLE